MNAKQKIVHGRGPSNINLGVFVCSFDVCRASKPFPSINYDESESEVDDSHAETVGQGCETCKVLSEKIRELETMSM